MYHNFKLHSISFSIYIISKVDLLTSNTSAVLKIVINIPCHNYSPEKSSKVIAVKLHASNLVESKMKPQLKLTVISRVRSTYRAILSKHLKTR